MDDLSQASMPVTRYELTRIQGFEAQGMSHEAAKAKVYAERPASGEPVSSGPSVQPGSSSVLHVALVGAGIGVAVGIAFIAWDKLVKTKPDAGDMATGTMSRP